MGVAPQHFPIFVTSNQCHLLDCKPCFKQAARTLVPQIMKVKINDLLLMASSRECRPRRLVHVWKNPFVFVGSNKPLLFDESHSIVTRDREQRYPLIIALFVSRILAVPDREHFCSHVEIAPGHAEDFLLPHGRGDREFYDPAHWNDLALVSVKMREQCSQFLFGRPAVAFVAFADQAKLFQRHTRQLH